jgi:ribosome-associated translation inhibitor RaiA
MSNPQTDLSTYIQLHFHPSDLEDKLGSEFAKFRQEELEKLSHIFDQKAIKIKQIILRLEQNTHLNDYTYRCEISLVSDTPHSDFNHSAESTDYQGTIRDCVNKLIEFVMKTKDKLQEKRK